MNDHFKVVYIKEINEIEPVPHLWENNGVVWFPKKSKEIRMCQMDIQSIPNKLTWRKYSCVVKAQGFVTFDFASETADQLCHETSSEEEQQEKVKRISRVPGRYKDSFLNFPKYKVVESVLDETADNCVDPLANCGLSYSSSNNLPLLEEIHIPEEDDHDNAETTITSTVTLASAKEIKTLALAIDNLKGDLLRKITDLTLQLDRIEMGFKKGNLLENARENNGGEEFNVFPLDTEISINMLEEKLKNEEYRKKVIIHLRRVIGAGFPWRSACYRLSSVLFTKNILTEYSWTGISRTTQAKLAFNKLVNILDLFYAVIRYADSTFTQMQKEQFFKDGVLKHSKSRVNPKKRTNQENRSENKHENVQEQAREEAINDEESEDDDRQKKIVPDNEKESSSE